MSAEQKLTVTINETAALLGISRPSVYMLLRTGQLHQIKVGARTFISRREVVAFVEGETTPAEQPVRVSEYKTRWGSRTQREGQGR